MPQPNNTDSQSRNMLKRLAARHEQTQKENLAEYMVNNFFKSTKKVFIGVGTTCYAIAKKALQSPVEGLHITTNCAPVIPLFLELQMTGALAKGVRLDSVHGMVDPETGVIDHTKKTGRIGDKEHDTLIWSPHGITKTSIESESHSPIMKHLIAQHKTIVLPLTWSKLGRKANNDQKVKKTGKAEAHKDYVFVFPDLFEDLPEDTVKHTKEIVAAWKAEANIRVLNPPSFLD